MSSDNACERLLVKAYRQLDAAGIPGDSWVMGGGTVLMLHFAHRLSKDVDIFFFDKQHLSAISPRVNDGVEDSYVMRLICCKQLNFK